MKFTFEESELINSVLADCGDMNKTEIVVLLKDSKNNTEDSDLIEIASNTCAKIASLDVISFANMVSVLPIDTFTDY